MPRLDVLIVLYLIATRALPPTPLDTKQATLFPESPTLRHQGRYTYMAQYRDRSAVNMTCPSIHPSIHPFVLKINSLCCVCVPGATAVETPATRTFDDYECSGNVLTDFPGLCALLDMKNIPALKTRSSSANQESATGGRLAHKKAAHDVFKPILQVELENGDPYCTFSIKIFGWTVDEAIIRVLSKILSASATLHTIYFWQAGLTDPMIMALVNAVCMCASLRVITFEGNPLVDNNHHLLFCEGSSLTHLNLRNNRIEDEGARLLGAALSTSTSANWNLTSLNLSFNHIGDVGAGHIAKGLRFNRSLLFLSLSNNQIGDSGATQLATIFGEVVLTHEEIVQRRKLLLEKRHPSSVSVDADQSCAAKLSSDRLPSLASNASLNSNKGENKNTAKKRESSKADGKRAPNKEPKCPKKCKDFYYSPALVLECSIYPLCVLLGSRVCWSIRGRRVEGQDMEEKNHVYDQEHKKSVEMVSPLLNECVQQRDGGELILPGNTTLASLSLAGNRITERSLPHFLASLQMQEGEKSICCRL
ncbi:leucine-rich repeat-containing protein 71 isoform X4 [Syngnathus acus]|uniref:leucine-rich repeat-containing protein 71 isoform X4 n=1 Tax=Syngnathus acus TaxID=161584 RepID=UPI0018861398|nr:leucine-rich repeat-containing protein 71 isoform X4 [Syngnathus acus]